MGSTIPDNRIWAKSPTENPMTNLLLEIVSSPAMGQSQAVLQKLDYIYRQPARQGNFIIRDRILYMKEIFHDDNRHVEHKIVPQSSTLFETRDFSSSGLLTIVYCKVHMWIGFGITR